MKAEILLLMLLAACTDAPPKDDSCASGCDDSADDSAADSADDSSEPELCATPVVTFERDDGAVEDLTATLLSGDYHTLDAPGRLSVCPGTWFARLLIRADVEVVGLGETPGDTILSGGEQGTILDVAGPDVTLTVSNVTLDRGAGLDVEHNSGGGGVYCEGFGAVVANDVDFTNNFANDGAGLYVEDCEVTITGARFLDNVSEDDGGAVTIWYSNATISGATFERNTGLDGGAMAVFYGSATLSDATFTDNSSTHFAGALWMYSSALTMANSAFTHNVNSGDDGGGLLVHGSATLDNVSFTDNGAVRGGGLFVYYEATIEGTSCNFSGNAPEDIYAVDYSEAGGNAFTVGDGYSFSCVANVCTPR